MDAWGIRTVSQAGIYATFALYLVWAMGKGKRHWIVLIGAVIYALVFEHFNMQRYVGMRGGYHYHPASWLMLWGDVPLYIPLAWGFILSTSMRVSNRLPLNEWARPFADALLALLLDLSLDAVAIRLRFWFWHDVSLSDAFFGVPSDNFLGWLLVTFTFSLLTRLLWKKRGRKGEGEKGKTLPPQPPNSGGRTLLPRFGGRRFQRATVPPRLGGIGGHSDAEKFLPTELLVLLQWGVIPPVAYGLYLRLEAIGHWGYRVAGVTNLREQLNVLGMILLVFCGMVLWGMRGGERKVSGNDSAFDRVTLTLPRLIFHLFGVIGLIYIPPETRSTGIVLLAFGVAAVETAITRFAEKGNIS